MVTFDGEGLLGLDIIDITSRQDSKHESIPQFAASIQRVVPGSIADSRMVKAGSVIEKIDGTHMIGLSFSEVMDYIRSSSLYRPFTIQFRHEDDAMRLRV